MQKGQRPDLVTYAEAAKGIDRPQVVAELIETDLLFRLRAGEPPPLAKSYFANFPDIFRDRDLAQSLLGVEFGEHWRRTAGVTRVGYLRWYPEYSRGLRAHLRTLWLCPVCGRETEVTDEAATEVTCQHCRKAFPTHKPASRPEDANRPYIPGYEILSELGRGGMGVVYKARQLRPPREVALKMVLGAVYASPERMRRFRAEAETAASLDHRGILPLFDVGEHGGNPYFTMRLLPGKSLDGRVGEFREGRQAAQLVAKVADAVHHAHQRGVLHRDLKPANILLDEKGEPFVCDFGLAKVVDADTSLSLPGQPVGTPAYMSPEQVIGLRGTVTTSSDVYGLGAILYELLTGRPPFVGETRDEILEGVKNRKPDDPRSIQTEVQRDLATICLKCLEKHPTQRYPSAAEMADDLGRFLEGRPVEARPVGWPECVRRWCLRNPLLASVLAVAAILVVSLVCGREYYSFRLRDLNVDLAKSLSNEQGARKLAEERAINIARHLHDLRLNTAHKFWKEANIKNMLALLRAERPGAGQLDLRSWDWDFLNSVVEKSGVTLPDLNSTLVQWEPRGSRLAARGRDGLIHLVDPEAKKPPILLGSPGGDATKFRARSFAWCPVPGRFAVAAGEAVEIWDTAMGKRTVALTGHGQFISDVNWSPDGRRLATASLDGTVKVWDSTTSRVIRSLPATSGKQRKTAWSPDGGRLAATNGGSNPITIWNASDWTVLATINIPNVPQGLAWSPDGRALAVGMSNNKIIIYSESDNFSVPATLGEHSNSILSVAWSSDGRRLATGGMDNTIKLWDPVRMAEIATMRGHPGSVAAVSWDHEGRRLASAGMDGTVKLWDTWGPQEYLALLHEGDVDYSLRWAPSGRQLASSCRDKVRILDATGAHWSLPAPRVTTCAWGPGDLQLATGHFDGYLRIWDTATRKQVGVLEGHSRRVFSASWTRDGRWLASNSADGTVRVWDANARKQVRVLTGFADDERSAGFEGSLSWSPDGKRLAFSDKDRRITVWDREDGTKTRSLAGHDAKISSLAWSSDGHDLASADRSGLIIVWEVDTGRRLHDLRGHNSPVSSVSWSADDRRLASATVGVVGTDGAIKIWDVATGVEVFTLIDRFRPFCAVSFSADGQCLAASTIVGELLIWRGVSRAGGGGPGSSQLYRQLESLSLTISEAQNHHERGGSFAGRRRFPEAIREYDRSIALYDRLVERGGQTQLLRKLADAWSDRGRLQLGQGELNEAVHDFDQAVLIGTRPPPVGFAQFSGEVAKSLVHRGWAKCRLKRPDEGIRDLDRGITVFESLLAEGMRFDIAEQLADGLTLRGIARIEQRRGTQGRSDIINAGKLYGGLIKQIGNSERLKDKHSGLPDAVAWTLSTHPDGAVRDGKQAVEFATDACRLTNWRDARKLATLAAACAESGDYEAASRWDRRAIELTPDRDPIKPFLRSLDSEFFGRGKPFHRRPEHDDLDKAVAAFTETIGLDARNAEAHADRAAAWVKKADYEKALADLDEAVKLDPRLPRAYALRGLVRYTRKEFDMAIADYDRALALAPDNMVVRLNRSDAWLAKKEYARALADLDRAIELEPDNALGYLGRGKALLAQGGPRRALGDLDRAVELAPANSEAHQVRGVALSMKGEVDGGLAELEEAIALNPGSVKNFVARGTLYYIKKAYDKAISDLDRAITLTPNDPGAYTFRGEVRLASRDPDGAIADLDRALALDPKLLRALGLRGHCRQIKKQYAKALADFDAVLGIDPDHGVAHNSRAWILAVCPDSKLRNGKQAVESATRACELTGWKDPNVIDTLAAAYAEAGDFAEAVRRQEEANRMVVDPASLEKCRERLELYRAKSPYREMP